MHGIRKSTVCRTMNRVLDAVVNYVASKVIGWPVDCTTLAFQFMEIGGFPSVCGAIDGTLIKIDSLTDHEEQYVDRHGNHSLNVMCVCGPDYKFYYVSSRFPGSCHNSRVFRASQLSEKFNTGWRPFPGAVLLGTFTCENNKNLAI